jgi:hypothetical protein
MKEASPWEILAACCCLLLLLTAHGLLTVCYLLFAVYRLLSAVGCLLFASADSIRGGKGEASSRLRVYSFSLYKRSMRTMTGTNFSVAQIRNRERPDHVARCTSAALITRFVINQDRGRESVCSPSLRTGLAGLPHPALQLVVHPVRG